MPRQALAIFLFVPLIASANCGFMLEGATMTIVVGSKANTCFSSEGFRQAFKADMTLALAPEESRISRKKSAFDQRNPSGQKLWDMSERNHQEAMSRPGYFGQKR